MTSELPTPWSLTALTHLSRLLPPVRGTASLAFSCIRPLYRGRGRRVLTIWPGIDMLVDPQDYLGGLLAFVPQLYDRWERQTLSKLLRPGDFFVDVGGNIGAYALWAARCVGPAGTVIAIEADLENQEVLTENVRLNGFDDRIVVCGCGVSDHCEVLPFSRNVTGNCGGHTFCGGANGPMVECVPLDQILAPYADVPIRLMKLDIEGFEFKVLRQYFAQVALQARPEYLMIEIDDGPAPTEDKLELRRLLAAEGYEVLRDGGNSLFQRRALP